MNDSEIQKFKIIFLGDQGVGKSSILNRFASDKFDPDYSATIGLDFHSKNEIIENQQVRLLLYDTAGQEKFKSLIPMYLRDAHIILIVYDITNKDSLIHTNHWVNEAKDKQNDAMFVLVGNKMDLNGNRAVSTEEAEAIAKEKGFIFQEVSAKTGDGINELFQQKIFKEMAVRFNLDDQDVGQRNTENKNGNCERGNNGGVKLNSQRSSSTERKKGCC